MHDHYHVAKILDVIPNAEVLDLVGNMHVLVNVAVVIVLPVKNFVISHYNVAGTNAQQFVTMARVILAQGNQKSCVVVKKHSLQYHVAEKNI